MKDLVLENTDVNKYYKSYIPKKNMITFNYRDDQVFYSDKYDSDNIINDIDNIENLEKKEEYLKPQLIKSSMTDDYDYNIDQMYIDLDAINFKQSKNSIKYFHHMGCDIKLMKCALLRGGKYNYEKIPKTFLDSKVISIIKNQDDKCFLYCYIRKHINLVKIHGERVSRVDKRLAKKLEEELNYDFDNVEIKQLSKIEDLLETNVYVYSCDENFKNKIPLFRSNKNFDKYLDLLLYEKHYMNVNKLNLFFNPNSTNKTWFCRSCNNSFYSKVKYDDHVLYCKTAKPLILMPSKNKYIKFKNIQNTIQLPFVAYCDIESELLYKKQSNLYNHEHLMSGYKLDCVDKKHSKPVKIFDTLEKFRDGLISELDYIDKINDEKLNHEIDMSTFNQEEFDNTHICKYYDYDFTKKFNSRKITLLEKVDKYKLKRIIDDYDNNDINEETQNNLIKYYNSLNKDGEINIIYKQHDNVGRYYSNKFSLQNMYNKVRSSIIHENSLDIDFVNSIVTIIIYLANKHNLKIPNIIKYSNDRENILKIINDDRMTAKKVIITILNGGFSDIHHDDKNLNKFLKNIEKELNMLHEYFYKIDKRINDEDIQKYKGKNFSRILQDVENQLLMYLYDYICFKKIKMISLVFDGIILFPKQQIDLNDAQNYIFNKSGIKMKIVIKPYKDYFQKFDISNVNIKEYKERYINKIYINKKVIHHLHYKSKNNIVDYICQNCNLKIKNKKQLVILFHNSKGYDNQYMLDIFSKIKNVRIECIGENDHKFKMLEFHILEKDYSIRIIDSLLFLQGTLEGLGIELEDDKK